jgi:hypothetical protein
MKTITAALATAATAGLIVAGTAGTALASTPQPHYFANDVRGTGRFGTPITGNAGHAISILAGRDAIDPAEFEQQARFAHYALPGGTSWLLRNKGAWHRLAAGFGTYLRSEVVEEVEWTSPYRTEYAVPHGTKPTTFRWTSMPDLTRDVLVFRGFDLVMNCGGQMYIPAKPIPLPSKPKTCKTVKGAKGKKTAASCAPCRPGTHLFNVPGVGAMCLCPQTVHVVVAKTHTVSVEIITKETTTTSTTTTVDYGVCTKKCDKRK